MPLNYKQKLVILLSIAWVIITYVYWQDMCRALDISERIFRIRFRLDLCSAAARNYKESILILNIPVLTLWGYIWLNGWTKPTFHKFRKPSYVMLRAFIQWKRPFIIVFVSIAVIVTAWLGIRSWEKEKRMQAHFKEVIKCIDRGFDGFNGYTKKCY